MLMTIENVNKLDFIEKIIIHSIDLSLFQVSIVHDDKEYFVTDSSGALLRSTDKLRLQVKFRKCNFGEMSLRHQSAYDEMIGLSEKPSSNLLEVPLGNTWMAHSN